MFAGSCFPIGVCVRFVLWFPALSPCAPKAHKVQSSTGLGDSPHGLIIALKLNWRRRWAWFVCPRCVCWGLDHPFLFHCAWPCSWWDLYWEESSLPSFSSSSSPKLGVVLFQWGDCLPPGSSSFSEFDSFLLLGQEGLFQAAAWISLLATSVWRKRLCLLLPSIKALKQMGISLLWTRRKTRNMQ